MKTLLLTRKRLLRAAAGIVGVLLLAAAFRWMERESPVSAELAKRLPIYGVNTREKKIALTFDCAWENSDTQALLSLLSQNEVKATFFVTGDWCSRYPEDVRAFFDAGHAVENHSYAHPHPASVSREALIADTEKCDAAIRELTGKTPSLYRAPYGEYSDEMLRVLEDELGKSVIQWDCDSRDWQKREAADMAATVREKVRPGSILLFHNDTENTPEALRQIIPELKGAGYEFVLVEELILKEGYTLDHEGRQMVQSARETTGQ